MYKRQERIIAELEAGVDPEAGSKAEDAKKDRVLVTPATDAMSHYGSEIELTDRMRDAKRPGSRTFSHL
jgi:hypothetical protein